MKYLDAHCHIQFEPYEADRDTLIATMLQEGVGGIVVGVDRASSGKALALAEMHEHLYAAAGLHPNDTPEESFDADAFGELAAHPKVVAIGECGLDFFRSGETEAEKERQRATFAAHIALAVSSGKPLMIHARPSKGSMDAYEEALSMLEAAKAEHPSLAGNFHFFVGTPAIAARAVSAGFTCSFTAVLTFSSDYDETVRALPLSHILSETDSPYVAPAPNRGKRNDPLAVREVAKALARIRGEGEEEVREALMGNARRLFGV